MWFGFQINFFGIHIYIAFLFEYDIKIDPFFIPELNL